MRATVRGVKRALAAAALGLVAACSSGGNPVESVAANRSTTTEPVTTTTVLSAEQEFLRAVTIRLGWSGADADASLDVAQSLCDLLDSSSTEAVLADDAANDSPESDAAVAREMSDMALAVAFTEYPGPDDVLAELLTLAGEHMCPERREVITNYIASQGIERIP